MSDPGTRFRLLMQNLHDYAIVMLDVDGRVVDWSAGAERLMGWTEAEILGQPSDIFFTPDDREKGMAERERSLAARDGRAENERWHMHKDGSRFWASGAMYAFREDGAVVGFCTIFRDATLHVEAARERGELLARAQIAMREAETANAVKDQFLAVLSHELRTPLNAVLGWTRMLRLPPEPDPARLRHALDVIERNGQRQQQMVDELLDVSRIVNGRFRLHRTNVELTDVLEHMVQSFRPELEDKRLGIDVKLPQIPCRIFGDVDRLHQIVWNLISNAIKFTPPGGHVGLELTCSDQHARLVVRDTGEGIDPGVLPHIFDRFRQGDSSTGRRHGGLGLGLAIVRHLVEAHGGSVKAESEGLGHGATFTVTIPLAGVERRSQRRRAPAAEASRPPDGSGVRVLVVDDDADALELLDVVLSGSGARVFKAGGAAEAMDILSRERVDVLVSDIGMPGEDGYALIRRVRALSHDRLPAVAVTAYVGVPDQRAVLDAGFDRHIGKPIDPEHVIRVVTELARR